MNLLGSKWRRISLLNSQTIQTSPHLDFLPLGPVFLNRRQLIIDDQIDLVTRGLMGFTVACARCHDHFHDPIPTADYYSLYGIFDASNKPAKVPTHRETR